MVLAVPCALAGVMTAASLSAPPPGRPDFSGEWRMNRELTRLEIARPDSTVFRIVHREPSFELSRTHVFEGRSDFFSISLRTDGQEVVVERSSGVTLHSRAFWEGDRLVFASRIVRNGEEATTACRKRSGVVALRSMSMYCAACRPARSRTRWSSQVRPVPQPPRITGMRDGVASSVERARRSNPERVTIMEIRSQARADHHGTHDRLFVAAAACEE